MSTCIIDLESSALPDEQLFKLMPEFEAPANYSDPIKISKAIDEKRQAWKDRAALSPLTGQILAIGMLESPTNELVILTSSEADMLRAVWTEWNDGGRFVGFNVRDFDFRFMVTRSRILGIPVPADLFSGRYWNPRIVDLMEVFCCFSRETSGYSLDAICRACGLGQKPEGITGKDFAHLFATNREVALDYLKNDLLLVQGLAQRLGIT